MAVSFVPAADADGSSQAPARPPVTLWDLLDDMYFSATSERDKGTKFERFLKAYLQTEPKYVGLMSV